tara:strand:- start:258 stop:839 length:582 start_codon:yes stop_codon:yes gene_type:complete
MKTVFIDGGGHFGESALKAKVIYGEYAHVVSVEPVPVLARWIADKLALLPNVEVVQAALGPAGVAAQRLYIADAALSSSVFSDKTTGGVNPGRSIDVRCVSLADIIPEDARRVVVKLNIEGGEYAVLESILAGHVSVDVLYVNWHNDKIPSLTTCHDEIYQAVCRLESYRGGWEAGEYERLIKWPHYKPDAIA